MAEATASTTIGYRMVRKKNRGLGGESPQARKINVRANRSERRRERDVAHRSPARKVHILTAKVAHPNDTFCRNDRRVKPRYRRMYTTRNCRELGPMCVSWPGSNRAALSRSSIQTSQLIAMTTRMWRGWSGET